MEREAFVFPSFLGAKRSRHLNFLTIKDVMSKVISRKGKSSSMISDVSQRTSRRILHLNNNEVSLQMNFIALLHLANEQSKHVYTHSLDLELTQSAPEFDDVEIKKS